MLYLICFQLGVHADGIKELFAGKIPQLKKDLGVTDFATILKIVSIVSLRIYEMYNLCQSLS